MPNGLPKGGQRTENDIMTILTLAAVFVWIVVLLVILNIYNDDDE
jgi:preprotein translocase subunit SecG